MPVWNELICAVARLYWPRILCGIGLHRWRTIHKYSADGVLVYFFGVPCKTHWRCAGEKCTRCGRRMREGQVTWRHWLGWSMVIAPIAAMLVLVAGWMALVYAAAAIVTVAIVAVGLVLVITI